MIQYPEANEGSTSPENGTLLTLLALWVVGRARRAPHTRCARAETGRTHHGPARETRIAACTTANTVPV
jgi:hypothetical protein